MSIIKICGLVVHTTPAQLHAAAQAIAAMPGCEVHLAEDKTGRLVVAQRRGEVSSDQFLLE